MTPDLPPLLSRSGVVLLSALVAVVHVAIVWGIGWRWWRGKTREDGEG